MHEILVLVHFSIFSQKVMLQEQRLNFKTQIANLTAISSLVRKIAKSCSPITEHARQRASEKMNTKDQMRRETKAQGESS